MTKPIICSIKCKLLSVDSVNSKNKEGKDVVYYSCSIFCPDNGYCGSLNVADKLTSDLLMQNVGTDVSLICSFNPEYKSLRVTNVEF